MIWIKFYIKLILIILFLDLWILFSLESLTLCLIIYMKRNFSQILLHFFSTFRQYFLLFLAFAQYLFFYVAKFTKFSQTCFDWCLSLIEQGVWSTVGNIEEFFKVLLPFALIAIVCVLCINLKVKLMQLVLSLFVA